MITKEEIINAVNRQLRGYPWGGKVVGVRKNDWDEWIVDCRIWGAYGYSPEDPNWRFYSEGDENCPIRQFMVDPTIDSYGLRVILWQAENDKRLPTFREEDGTLLDDNAPPSPYIVEPIKEYLRLNKNKKDL